jgi:hypothetical protein
MSSGPSREELLNYWKTSRAYFDELARHYKTSDPDYYKSHIEPFYTNPLYSAGNKSSGFSNRIIITIIIYISMIIFGIILSFIAFGL